MNRLLTFAVVAALLRPLAVDAVIHSKTDSYANRGVSISLHDPIGSVYREGEEVGFSIRTDTDAYVIVFDIDTDGFVHLLYPAGGENIQKFSSGRVYSLPDDPRESLVVGGAKGLEFVFALAVEDREAINDEEVRFLARSETLPKDRTFRVTGDPFLGANRLMGQLVRGISDRRDVTISFTYFYVGETVDFPRYLCESCYEKSKDPYAEDMPTYVANADFENTGGLTYPLNEAFAREYAGYPEGEDTQPRTQVTKVYVSYYPRWDDGFYNTSWWYLDPWYWNVWYWDPWYAPYSGFYVGIGWDWGWWGWGAYHYRYFPYYYCGPYYAYRPYRGYYSCYPDYWYGGWYYPRQPERWRSFGAVRKGERRSTLHTAMNQRVSRDFGLSQRSVKPSGPSDRRFATTKPHDVGRSIRPPTYTGTTTKSDRQVIRSRPTRSQTDRTGLSRDSRTIRSGKGPQREQRVITRPSKTTRSFTGGGKRTIDTKRIDRKSGELDWKLGEPRRPQTDVRPDSRRQTPESRGAYTPNVRRESGGKSTPPRATGSSQGRSSSSSSKATSPSKGSSRQKR